MYISDAKLVNKIRCRLICINVYNSLTHSTSELAKLESTLKNKYDEILFHIFFEFLFFTQ